MEVKYTNQQGIKVKTFDVKQRFENGYGAIIDFNSNIFDGDDIPKITILLSYNDEKYKNRRVELGYEIIDDKEERREINIMDHIYGMTENSETCYKIKEKELFELNKSVMLINIFYK